jgi:hypothetical protein
LLQDAKNTMPRLLTPPSSSLGGCQGRLLLLLTAVGAWQPLPPEVVASPTFPSFALLSTRRQWLGTPVVAAGLSVLVSSQPSVAVATEELAPLVNESRPYAPSPAALVPATEQRLLLRYALQLALQMTTTTTTTTTTRIATATATPTSTDTTNRWEFLRQVVVADDDENDKKDTGTRRAALGQANRAFFQPPSSTSSNPTSTTSHVLSGRRVRRACNYYTAQLRFADSYVLTGNAADRKQWIRQNNGLPDVKQVIVADLDLRDLYRNAVQSALQDAAAELRRDEPEAAEVVELLQVAETNLNQWFALIRPADVHAALVVVVEQ